MLPNSMGARSWFPLVRGFAVYTPTRDRLLQLSASARETLLNGLFKAAVVVTDEGTCVLSYSVSRYVRHARRMHTYNIVAARIAGISRVRTRDGCIASGERGKSIPIGVGVGTIERTVVLANIERQSTRDGE